MTADFAPEGTLMTLVQFKYVLEIAKTGSVNQAANNLFVSQSVLSNALKTLEKELGQLIFYRMTTGMQLTPVGENFVAYIKPIQMHLDQLNRLLQTGADAPMEKISVASTGFYEMSAAFSDLMKKTVGRQVRFELYETSFEESMNMVASELVDLAFVRRWSCYYKLTDKRLSALRLDYFPIKNFPMGVSVGRGSPLFEDPSGQVITDLLKSYPCIVYNYIDSGPYVDIYDRLQIPIKSRIVTNSRAVMYELLDQTPAFFLSAVTPTPLARPGAGPESLQVRTLELKNCPIRTEYGWITRRGHSRTALENACIDSITQALRA